MSIMNRFILILSLVFCSFNLLGQTSSTPFGAGTSISPYLISNLNELYWIQSQNKTAATVYIELTNDIDASATSTWTNGWEPIGGTFQGSFDGKGYTISNLLIRNKYITATSGRLRAGLFAATNAATIKNLILTVKLDLIPNGQSSAHPYLNLYGALTGSATLTTITDVRVTGEMINIDPATVDYFNMVNIGGIAGSLNNSTLLRCSFEGTLIGRGAVAGTGTGAGNSLSECYVDATMYVEYENKWGKNGYSFPGMMGRNTGGSFLDCYTKGTIYGYYGISGFSYPYGSTITTCYSAVDIVLRKKTGASSFNYSPTTAFCWLFSWPHFATFTDCISDSSLNKTGLNINTSVIESAVTTWSTYSAKNFSTSFWSINANINDGYPYLKNLSDTCITPAISGTTSLCVGASTTLTGSGTAAATSPWTSSDIAVATVLQGVVTGVDAGTVTITYTDDNGCSTTENITVNALPAAPTTSDIDYCQDQTATALSATAITAHSLVWYDTDGVSVLSSAPTPSTTTTTTTTTSGTTTYYVAQSNDNTGCEGPQASITVTVNYSNTGTDVITACDSYTWIDGNTYTASNNNATYTLTNQDGCDSLVTLDLNVTNINTSIIRQGRTLFAVAGYDSYQWYACNLNGLAYYSFGNQSNDSITISSNGDFTVVITHCGNSDTSTCISINDIGFSETNQCTFNLFPNPTSGIIKITRCNYNGSINIYQLQLIDNQGNLIRNETVRFIQDHVLVDLENLTSGVYQIVLTNESEIFHEKVSLIH